MPSMEIDINRVGDPPIFPNLYKQFTKAEHLPNLTWYVGFLEHGMKSGEHSIMLTLILPDGTAIITETSLALWELATQAFRGAKERWEADPR